MSSKKFSQASMRSRIHCSVTESLHDDPDYKRMMIRKIKSEQQKGNHSMKSLPNAYGEGIDNSDIYSYSLSSNKFSQYNSLKSCSSYNSLKSICNSTKSSVRFSPCDEMQNSSIKSGGQKAICNEIMTTSSCDPSVALIREHLSQLNSTVKFRGMLSARN